MKILVLSLALLGVVLSAQTIAPNTPYVVTFPAGCSAVLTPMPAPSPAPAGGTAWTEYTVPYTTTTAAALTQSVTLVAVPAKTVVSGIIIKAATQFGCSACGMTALTVSVGDGTTAAAFSGTHELFSTAVSDTNIKAESGVGYTTAAGYNIVATFTATGANLSALTAGSVKIWVRTEQLP